MSRLQPHERIRPADTASPTRPSARRQAFSDRPSRHPGPSRIPARWIQAQLHRARAQVLAAAYAAHPERFVHRPPAPKPLPTAVRINPPNSTQQAIQ
jgi:hypothetical protein